MNAQQILKRLSQLKAERIKHEPHWKDCFKYGSPERQQAWSDPTQSSLETDRTIARKDLYDTTAVEAINLLVSSIISGTTNPTTQWFKAIPGGLDTPHTLTEGEQWLDLVSEFMFRNIHSSNFDSEISDYITDLCVAGWAVLFIDTKKDEGGFVFNVWNIGNCYISSTEAHGQINTIYREFELSAEQIVSEFGIDNVSDKIKKSLEKNPDQKFALVQAIMPRDKQHIKGEEGKRLAKAMAFASYTVEVSSKHILRESGFESFPCIISRFKKLPDSHYGIGIMSHALPDAKTANSIAKISLQSAELNLGGLWMAQHDGVINPNTLRIRPNAVIAVSSPDAIKRLDTGNATGLGLEFLMHYQQKIKQTLMSNQLTSVDQSPLTATEVHARVQIQRQQLGSLYGRMQAEYLTNLLERVWTLSLLSGVLPPPPEELMQATRINFSFINPLASAQKLEHVTAIQQLMMNLEQMAQIDQTIIDNFNFDHAVQVIADGLNVPTSVVRTEEELMQLRQAKQQQQQAMQEQQAQQQMMQGMGQTAMDVVKDQAKQMTPEQLGDILE